MSSSLVLPSISLKKAPLNCSQSLRTHNISSFVGFKNGILRFNPRNSDGARVSMSVSVTSPSQTAVDDALFSDYKPSCAFLFPGQFGELQVEITPDKANIGAVIAVVFGILSWQISQGIQSIPESSLQYANDNALLLAKSLRAALLLIFYSSTLLSGFTAIGLVLLARQLKSKE